MPPSSEGVQNGVGPESSAGVNADFQRHLLLSQHLSPADRLQFLGAQSHGPQHLAPQ